MNLAQLKNPPALYLLEARTRKGLKMKDVACGICSPSSLSKYEKDLSEPSVKVLEQLFKRLEIQLPPKNTGLDFQTFFEYVLEGYSKEELSYFPTQQWHEYEQSLYQFYLHLTSHQLDAAALELVRIKKWAHLLDAFEQKVFLCFKGKYYMDSQLYEQAAQAFNECILLFEPAIPSLIIYYVGLFHHYLNRPARVIYVDFSLKEATFSLYFKYACLKIQSLVKLSFYEQARYELKGLKKFSSYFDAPFYQTEIDYLQLLTDMTNQVSFAATDLFQKLKDLLKYRSIIDCIPMLEILLQKAKPDYFREQLLSLEKYSNNEREEHIFNYYLYQSYDKIEEGFELYLTMDALPAAMESGHGELVKLFSTALIQFYKSKNAYKRAVMVYEKCEKWQSKIDAVRTVELKGGRHRYS